MTVETRRLTMADDVIAEIAAERRRQIDQILDHARYPRSIYMRSVAENIIAGHISALTASGFAVVKVDRERWKHVKRGSFYRVLGQGNAQVSSHIKDMEPVIIYQAEEGGSLWVRPATEFYDGRFVRS